MTVSFLLLFCLILCCLPHALALSTSNSNSKSNNMRNSGVSSAKRVYDLVVIGGGSAGLTAAKLASTFDKSCVIIEKAKMGGDCTWTGCVPSKSLIASAKVAHSLRKANDYGVQTPNNVKVDMKQIKERIQNKIDRIYREDDSPEAMSKLGIDTLFGNAAFVDPSTLSVSQKDNTSIQVEAKDGIVVATGARPRTPSIPGLDQVDYITYEQVFDLDVLPKRLTVMGGGPIGCELAQAFCRLGSSVTQIASKLLPREEKEISALLEQVFHAEGVQRIRGSVSQVEAKPKGGHIATCSLPDGTTTTIEGDVLLVAVGRAPNVQGMGLDTIGVALNDRGGIDTNDKLQTSVKNVYAAGDCTGGKQFTHYAGFQGAIAARNILLPFSDGGITSQVPAATFTSPEVSSVGLSEAEAIVKYGQESVGIATKDVGEIDRAICEGEELGLIKIVYLKKNLQILGASVMAPAAGELISEIGVAMKAKLPFDQLSYVIHSYPTYSIALQMMAADINYQKTLKLKPVLNFLKRLGL